MKALVNYAAASALKFIVNFVHGKIMNIAETTMQTAYIPTFPCAARIRLTCFAELLMKVKDVLFLSESFSESCRMGKELDISYLYCNVLHVLKEEEGSLTVDAALYFAKTWTKSGLLIISTFYNVTKKGLTDFHGPYHK